jgi:hypothetical protein
VKSLSQILAAAGLLFLVLPVGSAFADDPLCSRLSTPKSKAECNCAAEQGGTVKVPVSGKGVEYKYLRFTTWSECVKKRGFEK